MSDMLTFGKVVVNKFCNTHAEKIGAYRMFSNDDLSKAVIDSCKKNQGAKHLLCIQDTTELNFTNHILRIGHNDPDIGPVIKKNNAGFFCHPMLVVDPECGIPIGFSSVEIWNRLWVRIPLKAVLRHICGFL